MVETLEQRQLLTTTTVYSKYYYSSPTLGATVSASVTTTPPTGPYDTGGNFTFADPSAMNDSATLTLTGVPQHTMARVSLLWEVEPGSGHGTEGSSTATLTVTSGTMSETIKASNDQDTDPNGDPYYSETGNQGHWFADSGTTMTVTASAPNFPADGEAALFGLVVEVYTPTLSITGGGSTSEASATPVNFTITRTDTPSGYQGTPAGDAPIPDTVVPMIVGGTATKGQDWDGNLPNSVTLTQAVPSQTFNVTPINDSITESRPDHPEDYETVTWAPD